MVKLLDTNGQRIALNTEFFDFTKKIYMKNKVLNPTGVCNWACYQNRYPGTLGGMNQEEMKIYWKNTGQPNG